MSYQMNAHGNGLVERVIERLGWIALLGVLVALVWFYAGLLGLGVDQLRPGRGFSVSEAALPGVELTIVPLMAIAASRMRSGAVQHLTLRMKAFRPLLPLLMALSVVGLTLYLIWSWQLPSTVFGTELEFGPLRWLGTVLAAAFTWFWMPLFPHVTAILAGLIAGPTLFAVIGFTFFDCYMRTTGHPESAAFGTFTLSLLVTWIWILGTLLLTFLSVLGHEGHKWGRPLYHSAWSGVVMLAPALFGTLSYTAC